jgi:hypothetical protein
MTTEDFLEVKRSAAPIVKGARAMASRGKGVGTIKYDELEHAGQDNGDRRSNKAEEQ